MAEIRNARNKKRQTRREIRSMLTNVKTADRVFIKENIREAERYKKLVKKGVLISKLEPD
ncbi:hypothetical protein SCLARK_00402 [Spiroplasma clarkii]|uniref:hypothetical protein n=1 Tax=Spiroplasma clarkii TaxID=2139 RepID=UPI000B57A721|nr:hypothetical protein [Spiroplasma clarkii]ARU91127.1 hypothetical protein SCLARK_00402 [Spiroplasma clarkii]